MAKILFAWELGGGYGHVLACATLARALHAHGHTIALALRDRAPLAALPETKGYEVFEAPRHPREGAALVPASLADILLGCGYESAEELGTLLDGWLAIARPWQPDLVVCDYAPTALLAARMLVVPRVSYGNGFFTPPRLDPLPAFRFDEPVARERLRESNDRVLAVVNAALAARGTAPLARLADLFETDEDFLCTFPELDHYGNRPTSGYWGPRFRFDRGREMRWPAGPGKRVFSYLKLSNPHLDAFIDCFARGPMRTIVYIAGLDEERRRRLSTPWCAFSERPLRLDRVIRECDLLVTHGGELAGGALMCGVPSLLTPAHYEQYLTARRIEQLGAGGWLGPRATARDVAQGIERLLGDPRFRASAQAYARRYPAYSPGEQRRRIVHRIEEILAGRSLPLADAHPILPRSQDPGAQG